MGISGEVATMGPEEGTSLVGGHREVSEYR